MPPWAAPRMNCPLPRIASAPMRPLTAMNLLSLRATWTMGLGPSAPQFPENVVGPAAGAFLSALAWSAAALRRAPACSTLIGTSPAVRVLMNCWSSKRSRASVSSLSSGICVPGASVGVSPLPGGDGACATPGPTPATAKTRDTSNAHKARNPRFPMVTTPQCFAPKTTMAVAPAIFVLQILWQRPEQKVKFSRESPAAVQNESSERLHSFLVATAAWAGFAHRINAPERLTDGNYEGCLGRGLATCKYGKSEPIYL